MKQKLENFSVSYIETIAGKRQRNVEWAKSAVKESASITAEKALRIKSHRSDRFRYVRPVTKIERPRGGWEDAEDRRRRGCRDQDVAIRNTCFKNSGDRK